MKNKKDLKKYKIHLIEAKFQEVIDPRVKITIKLSIIKMKKVFQWFNQLTKNQFT
jgi:hypothetical protein